MRTLTINIDDDIFDKFLGFLDLLPNNKIKVFRDIPSVDEKEQTELEELLKNPDCHESSGYSKIVEI